MSEFMQTLERAAQSLRESAQKIDRPQTQHKAYIAVLAGVDLFMRFVNRSSHDFSLSKEAGSFEDFKETLLSRASLILEKASSARERVASIGAQFVHDDAVILVQGYSRVIMNLLYHAANLQNKRFKVYVTEGRPESDGHSIQAAAALKKAGIPCRAVLDSAVGYIMDKVDMVFVGAEGVVENGGIVNKIGTFQIALVAKALGKPVYAVAESYKFVRVYPLSQYDLPSETPEIVTFTSRRKSFTASSDAVQELATSNPSVDYTPPQYLTLLLTDLGVLTPSGVSDELIKLTLA
ncbi:IF-2B-domain-containing protein [Rhizopus microsporus var. microsporus]|uniref:Translation initiation factor eIF2B subunit alpha n=1 Tax=Rhizopus microsporus var. microsporus TaxID=86635 RepID=A0A1X0RFP6_RHIZD|nr:IF-2B-domain-containing protein [Rhizopus microsporus var. microsporus]